MRARARTLLVLAATALAAALPAPAKTASSAKAFRFKAAKLDIGALYRYEKTDLMDTRPAEVLLYVAGKSRLEMVRVEPGSGVAESFVVDMDWDKAGPLRYEEWLTQKDGTSARALTASFETDGAVVVKMEDTSAFRLKGLSGSFTVPFDQYPVHPLDLELMTLDVAVRFLADPTKEFEVALLGEAKEPAAGSGPFAFAGKAKVAYVEDVNRDGVDCRKYRIEGPGTGNQEGFLWVRKDKGVVVDMELPVATTADRKDTKLVLQGSESLDESAWQKRKAEELAKAFK